VLVLNLVILTLFSNAKETCKCVTSFGISETLVFKVNGSHCFIKYALKKCFHQRRVGDSVSEAFTPSTPLLSTLVLVGSRNGFEHDFTIELKYNDLIVK